MTKKKPFRSMPTDVNHICVINDFTVTVGANHIYLICDPCSHWTLIQYCPFCGRSVPELLQWKRDHYPRKAATHHDPR